MANSGTFAFIEALKEPTSNNSIRWEKSNVNPKTFNCEMRINDKGAIMNVSVIVDKYDVIGSENRAGTCLNFAIIENNEEQKVITSLVRCNNNLDSTEYAVLNDLYEKVNLNSEYFNKTIDFTMAS